MGRLIITLLFFTSMLASFADDENQAAINLQHGGHGNHSGLPAPADEPDVYYNSSSQSIIIDGTGYVSYYDVVIESTTSWTVMISTQVSGSYDTIDISSLPAGMYCITIDSPAGNSYDGFFDTY
jgi:hypothetical protein